MRFFTKNNKDRELDAAPKKPRHIEVWGHLVEVNRSLKRMAIMNAATALVAVCGLVWAMSVALSKPLIYYVDSNGHASYGGRLEEASQPLEVEVTYIAKEYLRRQVATNSLTVERDFADFFNLMTADLQVAEAARLAEFKRATGQSFVEYARAAGIRTVLEFHTVQIENHGGGEQFSVHITGTVKTWPIAGDREAEPKTKDFESHMALIAVERTEATPNGLLVSNNAIQFYESENIAEDLKDIRGLEGVTQ